MHVSVFNLLGTIVMIYEHALSCSNAYLQKL